MLQSLIALIVLIQFVLGIRRLVLIIVPINNIKKEGNHAPSGYRYLRRYSSFKQRLSSFKLWDQALCEITMKSYIRPSFKNQHVDPLRQKVAPVSPLIANWWALKAQADKQHAYQFQINYFSVLFNLQSLLFFCSRLRLETGSTFRAWRVTFISSLSILISFITFINFQLIFPSKFVDCSHLPYNLKKFV